MFRSTNRRGNLKESLPTNLSHHMQIFNEQNKAKNIHKDQKFLPGLTKSDRPKSMTLSPVFSSFFTKRKFCERRFWQRQVTTSNNELYPFEATRRCLTSGFKSRWTTPCRWKNATTLRICTRIVLDSCSGYLPPLQITLWTWYQVDQRFLIVNEVNHSYLDTILSSSSPPSHNLISKVHAVN